MFIKPKICTNDKYCEKRKEITGTKIIPPSIRKQIIFMLEIIPCK
jgi:hypothetical protein